MGKLKNFGKSYLKVSTFGLVDIDKKSKKRASEKSDTPAQKQIEEAPMGIFDKVKKFADDIEKKVENLDEKGKKLAERIVEIGDGKLYVVNNADNVDEIVLEDYYGVV